MWSCQGYEQSVFVREERAVRALNANILSLINTSWETGCKHVAGCSCEATVFLYLLPPHAAVVNKMPTD